MKNICMLSIIPTCTVMQLVILMNYVKHSSDVAAYIKLDDHWDVMWYGILMTKIGIVILLGAKIKT